MSKYLLVYIDEQEIERDAFEMYFENYKDEFEVGYILPSGKTIDQIIDEVIETNPNMVILDYNLKYSDDSVPDNGDVLMQRINDRKPLMPITLLTSYMKDAEKESFLSPEKRKSILNKSLLNDPNDATLKDEVSSYIIYNLELIKNYKKEFAELTQNEEPSPNVKARLIELDSILEESVDRQSAVKAIHKTDENFDELKDLIADTKELIKEFKKNPNA